MGPKIVGLYQRWDDSLFTTAPRGHEDINPIDPSSRPGLAMEAVLIENSRRQIVKQIMDKSRGLKPLQPDQYYHVARPKMRDRATYSGQSVSIPILHFLVSKMLDWRIWFSYFLTTPSLLELSRLVIS